ncbi:MAG: hypothetical protein ABIJ56_18880, partial [Pseudomonadota bacterium]
MKMWRETTALLMALAFPALLLAKVPGPPDMFQKIINVYGTYLPGTGPMQCGHPVLTAEEAALVKARFTEVAGWPNFRAIYPMGTWETSVSKCRLPLDEDQCHARLEKAGIPFEKVADQHGITNPVKLGPELSGVKLVSKVPIIVECDMALAMAGMAEILSKKDVEEIGIFSLHRPESLYSFHSKGVAVDVNYFKSKKWDMGVWVKTWFEKDDKYRTCDESYRISSKRGEFLNDIVCTL